MLYQRKKLWYLWATASLLIFVLLLWFTIDREVVKAEASYVWGQWFSIIVVSNLLIIVSTFVLEERIGLKTRPPASQFLFRICFGFSLIFLSLPLIAFLTHVPSHGIESFKTIGTICFVVEPLLAVTLGTFFYGDNIKEYMARRKTDV